MSENDIPKAGELTPFSEQIRTLGKGQCNDTMTELLSQVVREVRQVGGTGKVTLELTIKATDKDREYMAITPTKMTATLPKSPALGSVLYSTGDGDLLKGDPAEQENFVFGTVGRDGQRITG